MPDLTPEERERLAALRERFGDVEVEVERSRGVTGELGPIDPMLASVLEGDLSSLDETAWFAEVKYDGTRIVLQHVDGEVRAYSRRHVDRAGAIPDVVDAAHDLPDGVILDGELTYVDPGGVSTFQPIHTGAAELSARDLTPVYYAFDLLYADDTDHTGRPLRERKETLTAVADDAARDADAIELAPVRRRDFPGFYQDEVDAGEEGIVVKRRESRYYPGIRSDQWLKVKHTTDRDAIVVGYTAGEGARSETFGALVLSDGERCIGRVGTGFTEAELATLDDELTEVDERPFTPDEAGAVYTPVEPFVVTVTYQSITVDGKLRAPVYRGRNPEKPMRDVEPIET